MHDRHERKACSATVDPTFRSGPRATARYGTGGGAILRNGFIPAARGTARVKVLRSAIRRKRAELDAGEVAAASLSISRHAWHLRALARGRRIAGYVAVDGEVDCGPLLGQAMARGRLTYLPVVHGEKLLFAPASGPGPMVRNRFGIPEPAQDTGCWLRGMDLDVVLTPLVAFDDAGHRLGMGGGFYDRSFGFVSRRGHWRRPFLIGLAYEFQRVDAIASRRWDVPLHAIVTERGAKMF